MPERADSDLATQQQAILVKQMQSGRPEVGRDPIAIAQAKFSRLLGKKKPLEEKDRPRVDPDLVPAGGTGP